MLFNPSSQVSIHKMEREGKLFQAEGQHVQKGIKACRDGKADERTLYHFR